MKKYAVAISTSDIDAKRWGVLERALRLLVKSHGVDAHFEIQESAHTKESGSTLQITMATPDKK